MFKKIDCVMVKVSDLEAAVKFYSRVFGLKPLWQDDGAVGMRFADSDAEVVLHTNQEIPVDVDVNYLVENVLSDVENYRQNGCEIVVEPFDIPIGKCAVVKDPFGIVHSILDLSKGLRKNNFSPESSRPFKPT